MLFLNKLAMKPMTSLRVRTYLIVIFASFFCSSMHGQLVIDNSVTAADAIQNILLGGGVQVFNVTYSGAPEQVGSFDCVNCNLGIESGFVMGSGNTSGAAGPNTSGSFSLGPASGIGASDPDLFLLSNNPLNDAAILEFDFIPTGDSVGFNFVFGSDEYPEFAGSSYNDAFGFFLSGPGIAGPYSNNATNIALVPNTSTAITINNINNGTTNTGPCNFCQYYTNNINNFGAPITTIQSDGFTTLMVASADVICGETYHIKLAIADAGAGDTSYDSFVFFQANSFTSNQVDVSFEAPAFVSPAVNGLYEGCQTGFLVFTRPANLNNTATYNLMIGGTADLTDVLELPSEITFLPLQSQFVVPITAVSDGVFEGAEVLELSIDVGGCQNQLTVFEVEINDLPELQVTIPNYSVDCGGEVTLTPEISGGIGFYHLEWETGATTNEIIYSPNATSIVSFTVTDTCGVTPFEGFTEVVLNVGDPIEIDLGSDLSVTCIDLTEIVPTVTGGFGSLVYEWSAQGNVLGNGQTLAIQTDEDVVIALEISDECGATGQDFVELAVPQVNVNLSAPQTISTPCLEELEVTANGSGGVGNITYTWYSGSTVLGTGVSFSQVYGEPESLTIEALDECGNIAQVEVQVEILPSPITVNLGPDIAVTCIEQTLIQPIISGGVGNFDYLWTQDGTTIGSGASELVSAYQQSNILLLVEDECGNVGQDNLNIEVPPVPINITLSNDTLVCNGASVNLTAQVQGGVGAYITEWIGTGSNSLEYFATPTNSTSYLFSAADQCGNTATEVVFVNVDEIEPLFSAVYTSNNDMHFENLTENSLESYWIINGEVILENSFDYNFQTTEEWNVELFVESFLGCPASISSTYFPIGDLFVPNAFTPNNDGTNDYWTVKGHDLAWMKIQVFDRWGNIVFESEEVNPIWDGSLNNGDYFVKDGVYSYQLTAQGTRGNVIEKAGIISVLR